MSAVGRECLWENAEICKFGNRLCDSRAEYSETGSLICSDAFCRCRAVKRERRPADAVSSARTLRARTPRLEKRCFTESHYCAVR